MSFGTLPCGEEWVVVDDDTGRPITGPRATHQSAAATANILNKAAQQGGRALARALGCVEEGESELSGVRF